MFAGRSSEVTREGTAAVIHALVSSLAGADLAPDAPLSQAGLDSLASVELRNELSRCWASLPLRRPESRRLEWLVLIEQEEARVSWQRAVLLTRYKA